MANTYRRYGLTGGGSGSLDALDGTALASGDVAISVDSSNVAYVHSLNPSDGGAESSPTTIAPDTNAGTKRWKLSSLWATAFNALTLAAQAVGFTISGGTTSKTLTVEDNSLVNQDLTTDASPTFATAKLSGLTDGYLPKHTSDAVGLVNSPVYTDGTNVGVGTTSPWSKLSIPFAQSLAFGSSTYSYSISRSSSGSLVTTFSDSYADGSTRVDFVMGAGATTPLSLLGSGAVGVSTIAPASPLAVNRQTDDGVIIDLEQADTVEGTISVSGNTVSYNAFVGSHYAQLKTGQNKPPIGAVVISDGTIIPCEVTKESINETIEEISIEDAIETVVIPASIEKTSVKYEIVNGVVIQKTVVIPATEEKIMFQLKPGVTFNEEDGIFKKTTRIVTYTTKTVTKKEYFPYIDTTSMPADKRVYGVWMGKMKDNSLGHSFGMNNKSIYLVAQVGLFKIRVTDTNGNIENGDFLETSSRPNEAQKQATDRKLNSTVAKAMVSVDWAIEAIDSELGYKWKLIPCIF